MNYLQVGLGKESTLSAMKAFLGQKTFSDTPAYSINTQQLYERELYKFQQFLEAKGIPDLRSVSRDDIPEFTKWLKNPPSYLVSVNGRKAPRSHPDWRLFAGPQSPSSIAATHRAVKSFFSWLRSIGFIQVNPWALSKEDKKDQINQTDFNKRKTLKAEDIKVIQMFLGHRETDPTLKVRKAAARYRWVFYAYALLGLRASELLNANTNQLIQKSIKGQTIWKIVDLIGKGGIAKDVSVPNRFVDEMKLYRESLGKPSLPLPDAKEPFLFNFFGSKPLATRQQVFNLYKDLMKEVCNSDYPESEEQRMRLLGSSPHSLRHTFVTSLLDITNDFTAVKNLARHSNIETTIAYDDTPDLDLNRLIDEMAKRTF